MLATVLNNSIIPRRRVVHLNPSVDTSNVSTSHPFDRPYPATKESVWYSPVASTRQYHWGSSCRPKLVILTVRGSTAAKRFRWIIKPTNCQCRVSRLLMLKTSQIKTACKDDSDYIAQLKQQKSKRNIT